MIELIQVFFFYLTKHKICTSGLKTNWITYTLSACSRLTRMKDNSDVIREWFICRNRQLFRPLVTRASPHFFFFLFSFHLTFSLLIFRSNNNNNIENFIYSSHRSTGHAATIFFFVSCSFFFCLVWKQNKATVPRVLARRWVY